MIFREPFKETYRLIDVVYNIFKKSALESHPLKNVALSRINGHMVTELRRRNLLGGEGDISPSSCIIIVHVRSIREAMTKMGIDNLPL